MGSAALDQLHEDGYVVLPEVLSPTAVRDVREQLAPYLQGEFPGRNDFEGLQSERVYGLLDKAPAVAELVANEHTLPLLDAVLEPNYLLSACLAILLHPGETAQAWHYDDAFVILPRPRPSYSASTIWAIDDFTAENGATEVLPGSHRWAPGDTPENQGVEPVVAEMPAGSVIVFLGMTLHRGGANRSYADRLAITPQYCAPWARPQETFMLSVRREMAARYPERVQQLLGYSIHPPFMGHADGRHPAKVLDSSFSDTSASARSADFWVDYERAGQQR